MKLEWSWQQTLIFVVTLVVCAILIYLDKAHVDILAGPLALLAPFGPTHSPPPTPSQGGAP